MISYCIKLILVLKEPGHLVNRYVACIVGIGFDRELEKTVPTLDFDTEWDLNYAASFFFKLTFQ